MIIYKLYIIIYNYTKIIYNYYNIAFHRPDAALQFIYYAGQKADAQWETK